MAEHLLHGSYLAIVGVLFLSGVGLPVPEEVPIIAAGVLSAHGHLDPCLALAACIVGAVGGDSLSYWIGRALGRRVLQRHHWFARCLTPEREARIEAMIQDHGPKVFLVARFLVGLRSAIYLTAGILRVPFWRFLCIDSLCAGAIISVFFGLSYAFGDEVARWVRRAEWTVTATVVAALVVGGVLLWRKGRRRLLQVVEGPPPVENATRNAS